MTSNEFIFWLRGFTQGVNYSNITPIQWQHIKDMLDTVESGSKWKSEHGNNSPKFIGNNTITPPYTTGGDDEFIPNKELLLSNK